jgi:hypothetical protein
MNADGRNAAKPQPTARGTPGRSSFDGQRASVLELEASSESACITVARMPKTLRLNETTARDPARELPRFKMLAGSKTRGAK